MLYYLIGGSDQSMGALLGIVALVLIIGFIISLVGIAASLLAYLIIFFLLLLAGGIVHAIFGWPGLIIFITICIMGFFGNRSSKKGRRRRKPSREEALEELEDYDYLDDMTGRDDKPWI